MNPIGKPITIIAIAQAAAVFLAYCGGLIGAAFWEKWNRFGGVRDMPHLTYFYAHFGLCLLILPFVWAMPILIKENSPRSRWPVEMWLLLGVALAAVIGITGVVAFVAGFRRMLYW